MCLPLGPAEDGSDCMTDYCEGQTSEALKGGSIRWARHPIAPIASDDGYPLVCLANVEMEFSH
jgi:hypothetical protein